MNTRNRYRDSKLIRTGALLFLIGPGFLFGAYAISRIMGDEHPNPVGPGLLAYLLFWPSLVLIGLGVFWTFIKNSKIRKSRIGGSAT